MQKLKALYILDTAAFEDVYDAADRATLAGLLDIYAPQQTAAAIQHNRDLLRDVEVILSGWGAPLMDAAFLDAAPRLQVVFYAAGTVRYFVTDAFWERGIRATTAVAANARPVAEYTLAAILFSLKHGWRLARETAQARTFVNPSGVPGCYGSTVGLIGLSTVGRLVREHLRRFELRVLAYDPTVTPDGAARLAVDLVPLDELFRVCDVVSLHAPVLETTRGMIGGAHIASVKTGAAFINTARGALVREAEMTAVLAGRPDLQAVIDVTDPEPPMPDSPLYTLPNVVLTPHAAGALGLERRRLGHLIVDEVRRYMRGEPLQWELTRDELRLRA